MVVHIADMRRQHGPTVPWNVAQTFQHLAKYWGKYTRIPWQTSQHQTQKSLKTESWTPTPCKQEEPKMEIGPFLLVAF